MTQYVEITVGTSAPREIQVGTTPPPPNVEVTVDPSSYYVNLAKEWATKMSDKVANDDYSSKYYAEQSKQSAEVAKMEASTATGLKDLLKEDFDGYTESLNDTKNLAIEEINASVDPVLEQIEPVTIVANNIDTVTEIGENLDDILNKTVTVGKTTTGAAGTQARVVNAGTKYDPVLNFTIPRGEKGEKGEDGTNGLNGGMTAVYENETLSLFSETGTMLQPRWGMIVGDIKAQTDLNNAFVSREEFNSTIGDIESILDEIIGG